MMVMNVDLLLELSKIEVCMDYSRDYNYQSMRSMCPYVRAAEVNHEQFQAVIDNHVAFYDEFEGRQM